MPSGEFLRGEERKKFMSGCYTPTSHFYGAWQGPDTLQESQSIQALIELKSPGYKYTSPATEYIRNQQEDILPANELSLTECFKNAELLEAVKLLITYGKTERGSDLLRFGFTTSGLWLICKMSYDNETSVEDGAVQVIAKNRPRLFSHIKNGCGSKNEKSAQPNFPPPRSLRRIEVSTVNNDCIKHTYSYLGLAVKKAS